MDNRTGTKPSWNGSSSLQPHVQQQQQHHHQPHVSQVNLHQHHQQHHQQQHQRQQFQQQNAPSLSSLEINPNDHFYYPSMTDAVNNNALPLQPILTTSSTATAENVASLNIHLPTSVAHTLSDYHNHSPMNTNQIKPPASALIPMSMTATASTSPTPIFAPSTPTKFNTQVTRTHTPSKSAKKGPSKLSVEASTATSSPKRKRARLSAKILKTETASSPSPITTTMQKSPQLKPPLNKTVASLIQNHAAVSSSSSSGTDSDGDSIDAALGEPLGSNQITWNENADVAWHTLFDANMQPLKIAFRAEVDKGFKVSATHDSHICQKKNHFQVTVATKVPKVPKFVGSPGGVMQIVKTKVILNGVRLDDHEHKVQLEQSLSNRDKIKFESTDITLVENAVTKTTIGRLHFTETTGNNMRKRGQPNPDQKYLALIVTLEAHTIDGKRFPIMSYISDRIIVRASNPGQFETEPNVFWLKGRTMESIYYQGAVGINNSSPDEALCINGNFAMTGTLIQPSDQRVKTNIVPRDGQTQLTNLKAMKFYNYSLKDAWADSAGIDEVDRHHQTSVLAQELQQVLPEAVKTTSDRKLADGSVVEQLLIVNKDRLIMEGLGALKQLANEYDSLEARLAKVHARTLKLRTEKQAHEQKQKALEASSSVLTSFLTTFWSVAKLETINTIFNMATKVS